MTIRQFANEIGVAPYWVRSALLRMGIEVRRPSEEMPLGYAYSVAKLIITDLKPKIGDPSA